MTTRNEFLAELADLARDLIPAIADNDRASDEPDDDVPGMQVTIGVDESGWSFQIGDNLFTGGVYGYANWGIGYLYRDTDPVQFAEEILADLESAAVEPQFFYYDGAMQP